jgi:hypothetical protein
MKERAWEKLAPAGLTVRCYQAEDEVLGLPGHTLSGVL